MEVSPSFFVDITWERITSEVRGSDPVLLVCGIPQCKWTVVHALSPIGSIFKSVSIYPAFDNALSEWLITIAKDAEIGKRFVGTLRSLGIRRNDSEVFYFGDYPNRMSGFDGAEEWELLRLGRYISLTIPDYREKSAVEYLCLQIESFGENSFEKFPDNQKLYDPTFPEDFSNTTGWLFEDRGNRVFYGAPLASLQKIRMLQIRSLEEEIDHVGKYGVLARQIPKRFLSKHPLLVRSSRAAMAGGQGPVSLSIEEDSVASLARGLMELEVEVFKLRAKLVRELGSLMFYESSLYAIENNNLNNVVRQDLLHYVRSIEKKYPVICQVPEF